MSKNEKNLAWRAAGMLLAVSCLLGFNAFAQGTSVLIGTLSDAATRAPVADAVVTVTSPSMQGEQVAVSDATGSYRVAQLPPGIFTIRVEKEAFKPYSRGDIEIRADRTIRLNIEILPEALRGEEIIVVGRAPTIDVGSSSTGVNVSADFIKNLALSRPTGRGGSVRSFESLALVAPQTQSDLYGVSLNGTTSPENSYLLDGLSVNNPAYGLLGSPISSEFLEEVSVITGGYMPEYGRSTGGILSAVTKSGSNEFHGAIWGFISPGATEGNPNEVVRQGQTISTKQSTYNLGDIGGTIGGPIMKDKLWFFAGIQPSAVRYKIERNLNAIRIETNPITGRPQQARGGELRPDGTRTGFILADRIPGTTTNYFADQRALQYIGKLTYLVNQDNRLSLDVLGTPNHSGGGSSLPFAANSGNVVGGDTLGQFSAISGAYSASSTDVVGKWASSYMDKRFLLDGTVGWHHQAQSNLPVDESSVGSTQGLAGVPSVRWRRTTGGRHVITEFEDWGPDVQTACNVGTPLASLTCPLPNNYATGGRGFINEIKLNNWQGKLVGTYLFTGWGHHVFKAGFDGQVFNYDHNKAYTGTVIYRENGSGTAFTDFRGYGYLQAPDTPFIIQNAPANSTSNILGGFVQDSWNVADLVTINAGVRYDRQSARGEDGTSGFTLGKQWSPRLGVIYDFTRQGRSKIYANYARYYENIPLDALDREFPGERQLTTPGGRTAAPNAATGAPGCDPRAFPDPTAIANCRDPRNLRQYGGGAFPNRFYDVVGADTTPIDPDLQAQSSDEWVAGAEYEVLPNGRVGASYTKRYFNRVIEDASRDEANTYILVNPGYGIASDFPKAVRDYDAVSVYFSKAFADLWLAQASYTWSKVRGNYAGLFRPETGQLDPNINSDFDLRSLLLNRTGPLPGDSTHQVKLFVAKEFVVGGTTSFSLGGSYLASSGGPISYLGSHPLYGAGESFILPRGAGGRLPWVHTIDGHLGLNYRLSRDNVATVNLDVFNLFNFQAATAVDQTYSTDDVYPIANGTVADLDTCDNPDPNQRPNCKLLNFDDGKFTGQKNPNFKNPTAYQAPRIFRFGARVTF